MDLSATSGVDLTGGVDLRGEFKGDFRGRVDLTGGVDLTGSSQDDKGRRPNPFSIESLLMNT